MTNKIRNLCFFLLTTIIYRTDPLRSIGFLQYFVDFDQVRNWICSGRRYGESVSIAKTVAVNSNDWVPVNKDGYDRALRFETADRGNSHSSESIMQRSMARHVIEETIQLVLATEKSARLESACL
ncbi:hypothetical protein CODIS_14040 [Candidatus Thiodiazotropha endolucinida]|uniref:Uncharacterized protein n=1 Tax=Candidatus Thiodiazotropha endolucinida TaxID=1655433 RepID=A0A7Z0VMH4_9GAMM|nr:hypothetical protein CODIS_14040 [Candidatus Thiodiazotropha endolucinida]